jgi:transcriptional regulator with XRE-family HTH domain
MNDFGEFLKAKRKAKSLTLKELAYRCGGCALKSVTPQIAMLSRWETGANKPLPQHRPILLDIGSVLQMNESELNELLIKADLAPIQAGDADSFSSAQIPKVNTNGSNAVMKDAHKRSDSLANEGPIEILRHERQKHIATVLNLLSVYTNQLRESREPEHFIPTDKGELSEKEFAFWYYVKKAIPSLDTIIDSQIDSESLAIGPKLESAPSFAALESHYKDTKLWENINGYKKLRGQYWSIGFKLRRTIMKLLSGPFTEETKAQIFRDVVVYLLKEELAPIRARFLLEGIDTEKDAVLERLPDLDSPSLRKGVDLFERYLSGELTNSVAESKLLAELFELLERLGKTYETVKMLEHGISKAVQEEKLGDTLPGGTTCKFCPTI